MDLNFFSPRQETPQTLRKKAGDLLAQLEKSAPLRNGAFHFGETSLNRAGKQSDFRQFRPYNMGDRPTDIDWKRSGRSDDLLVREREENRRRLWDIHIVESAGLNFRSKNSLPSKRETAALLAVTFSLWAARQHDTVRFGGDTVTDIAVRVLEEKKSHNPDWKKNSTTIILGDFIAPFPDIENYFSLLDAEKVIWLQILDPAELDLPYHGRAIFEDAQKNYAVDNADTARSHYMTALQTHIASLSDLALKRNWHFETLRSDSPLSPVLMRALQSAGDHI